jgi:flagellar motor switch protein FliM
MVLGPDKKLGIIRDTTFQPLRQKRENFQINLSQKILKLEVEATLSYVLRPGDVIPINRIKRKVEVRDLF